MFTTSTMFCRYDRHKLTLKEIHGVQYVACMNPTSGSFTINPRLQRHFSVFAVSFPGKTVVGEICKGLMFKIVFMILYTISSGGRRGGLKYILKELNLSGILICQPMIMELKCFH